MQSSPRRGTSYRVLFTSIFGVLTICALIILYYSAGPTERTRGRAMSSASASCKCPSVLGPQNALRTGSSSEPCPAAAPSAAVADGLARIMSEPEVDEVFRWRSEIDGSFGTADAEMLLPYFQVIYGRVRADMRRLGTVDQLGGFVDVGANVGAMTAAVVERFGDWSARAYQHALSAKQPTLVDGLHTAYDEDRLAFVLAVEASPATLTLLQRRAEFYVWEQEMAKVVHAAASNSSGSLPFCYAIAGSEQSGIAGKAGMSEEAKTFLQAQDGSLTCADVRSAKLADLVDEEAGKDSWVFLLKVDAEGADGLVLAGARRLFEQQRVRYVVFEGNSKWLDFPDVENYARRSIGEVVTDLHGLGYACYYVHPMGLFPFPAAGTPEGQRTFSGGGEEAVSRHQLYNRHFWSNVLCGKAGDPWLAWLQNAMLVHSREEFMAKS